MNAAGILGDAVAKQVRDLSIRIYEAGRDYARGEGHHRRGYEI